MYTKTTLSLTTLLLISKQLCNVNAALPTAQLDYGTFQGSFSSSYNINYFRKIPFAAPPTGRNRFRAPQPPANVGSAVYNSDQDFDACPQKDTIGSEDCLYLGLFSRPWSKGQSLRPVLVNFYGGGFIQGGGSFTIPPAGYPTLNVSTQNDFVMVYPNYRVNAFGFLPGNAIEKDPYSDLNPGLLDQYFVLQWVNKYISNFGGNPANVTIWGQSAGAGSVVAQVIAQPKSPSKSRLFTKALASSPFWPKTYRYNDPQVEEIYSRLVKLTDCSGSTDTLACLKSISFTKIRSAAGVIAQSHTYNTSSFTWAPVIDNNFLTQTLTNAVSTGKINTDFNFGIYNSHEGENFLPAVLHYDEWLAGFVPGLSAAQLAQVGKMYPETGTTETMSYDTNRVRCGLIFRDVQLACPVYWIAQTAKSKGYVAEYAISPAKHGSDTAYWNRVNPLQVSDSFIYKGYTGAFASFIQTGDPNAHKLTPKTTVGVPLTSSGQEFVVEQGKLSNVSARQLAERCAMWKSFGNAVPI